jgi:hypothetical protein
MTTSSSLLPGTGAHVLSWLFRAWILCILK